LQSSTVVDGVRRNGNWGNPAMPLSPLIGSL
jgi:hypothetical protein